MTTGTQCKRARSRWLFTGLASLLLCSVSSPTWSRLSLGDSQYDHLFQANARAYMRGYDWRWLKAQAWQESRYNPAAVSPANAQGVMQIMPGTQRDLARQTGRSGSPFDPALSIFYGAVYNGQMLRFWHAPRTDDERRELATASYNAGPGNILKAQDRSGGKATWPEIAPFLVQVTGRHSKETIDYVQLIERWKNELERQAERDMGPIPGVGPTDPLPGSRYPFDRCAIP